MLANARAAEPQGRKSASVMDVKKEAVPAKVVRGSAPNSGSGGPPAGRAQKNEQKYN